MVKIGGTRVMVEISGSTLVSVTFGVEVSRKVVVKSEETDGT